MHFTKYIARFDALHFQINFGTIYILLFTTELSIIPGRKDGFLTTFVDLSQQTIKPLLHVTARD